MCPISMHSSMSIVKIPTDDQAVCQRVRSVLVAEHHMSVSGWTPLPRDGIACYFRLSAQVYLEMSDFERLGELVLQIIAAAEAPAATPRRS